MGSGTPIPAVGSCRFPPLSAFFGADDRWCLYAGLIHSHHLGGVPVEALGRLLDGVDAHMAADPGLHLHEYYCRLLVNCFRGEHREHRGQPAQYRAPGSRSISPFIFFQKKECFFLGFPWAIAKKGTLSDVLIIFRTCFVHLRFSYPSPSRDIACLQVGRYRVGVTEGHRDGSLDSNV